MRILSANLPHSSVSIYQLGHKTADEFHDHGPFYQVSIPLVGDAFMDFHGETKKLEDRAVTMVGEEHRNFTNDGPIRLLLISLEKQFLSSVYKDKTGIENHEIEFKKWGTGSSEPFKKLGKTVLKSITNGWDLEEDLQQLEWEMASLLLNMQDGSHTEHWLRQPSVLGNATLQRVIDFMRLNYNEELSVQQITSHFGVSQMQLYRMFQEHIGVTPSQYLKDMRLQSASQLLKNSNKDITTISMEVGFGSISSFERTFKKKYGMTPREFKSKI